MAKKDKTPAQAKQLETLNLISSELKTVLNQYKSDHPLKTETDTFTRGVLAGYEYGMKKAIEIVNYQIGIRQNPPNINYPGERPQ
jgi:hypothetical protein